MRRGKAAELKWDRIGVLFIEPLDRAVGAEVDLYVLLSGQQTEGADIDLVTALDIADIRRELLTIFDRFLEYTFIFVKCYNSVRDLAFKSADVQEKLVRFL